MKNCDICYSISLNYYWNKKCVIRFCTEKGNTHFMSNNIRPNVVGFIEIKCKYHDGIRHTNHYNLIRRMRFAYWITETTDKHTDYVTLVVSPLEQWLYESVSILRCTYIELPRTKFVSNVMNFFINKQILHFRNCFVVLSELW